MKSAAVIAIALLLAGCSSALPAEQTVSTTADVVPRVPVGEPAGVVNDAPLAPGKATRLAATGAARRFIGAYLAFTYGHGDALLRHAPATPTLVAQLLAAPPIVPATVRALSPRVTSLALAWQGPSRATAVATVDDGTTTYPVAVVVAQAIAAFRVEALEP